MLIKGVWVIWVIWVIWPWAVGLGPPENFQTAQFPSI